jgi:hypothetical protein
MSRPAYSVEKSSVDTPGPALNPEQGLAFVLPEWIGYNALSQLVWIMRSVVVAMCDTHEHARFHP